MQRIALLQMTSGIDPARKLALGLGQMLGLSFQQIQKYERGENMISAVRLLW